MAWVRFSRPFDWRVPGKAVVILAYRGGRAYSVKADVAKAAVAVGAASRIQTPKKGVDPNEVADGARPESG